MRAVGPSNDSGDGKPSVGLTAAEIAEIVGGALAGDPEVVAHSIAPLDRAGAGQLSFVSGPKYARLLADTGASVVLLPAEHADEPATRVVARIVVAKPHDALAAIVPLLYPAVAAVPGVHPTAVIGRHVVLGDGVRIDAHSVIGDNATIGAEAWIGASCVIGMGASVGAGSRLFPSVTIGEGARVGARVLLHSGVRIGGDGFGYVFRDGVHAKIPHVGGCVIEDDVEIGSNSTIDRGSIDDTVIGAGTKIDNLVHVAHNVRVGRKCLLMAHVGIAGSARIGDGCILAGQAGIGGHVVIGAGARIGGQAGVFGDVPAGETWSGYPARRHRDSLRATAALFKLAEIVRPLERLLRERAP